jgi:hypothetical protein
MTIPPVGEDPTQSPYCVISQEGRNLVQLLSTDWVGNVEDDKNDFTVNIDKTPPAVTFPNLRPNYLTSEDFTVTWSITDGGLSGVELNSMVAYLDGNLVADLAVIDLSNMAGSHTLTVDACDRAGNCGSTSYRFEVWIDATAQAMPVQISERSGGVMTVQVQFPPPYDVAAIDLRTATLSVKGSINVQQTFPITGHSAFLSGLRLTGVGDLTHDGLPDRGIAFDKGSFIAGLDGAIGDIASVVAGSLTTPAAPRYIANVVTPVFSAPR